MGSLLLDWGQQERKLGGESSQKGWQKALFAKREGPGGTAAAHCGSFSPCVPTTRPHWGAAYPKGKSPLVFAIIK